MSQMQPLVERDVFKPDPQHVIEPSARWVRVKFNGEFVADSKRVLLFRPPRRLPIYYFPREDVRLDRLVSSEHTTPNHVLGRATYWSVQVGDRIAEKAAWAHLDPPAAYSQLREYIAFEWRKMDHWYEEEEEVFAHPRDPYHRVDVMPSSRHVRVVLNGVTLAETRRPYLLFETGLPTRYYIPTEDVRMDVLHASDAHTICPYKGIASYWSAAIGENVYKDIVWSYLDPIPEIPKIKGLLAFYNEKVDLYVDDALQEKPKTPWS
jgi:uncharacterized protein (DUF427 family)